MFSKGWGPIAKLLPFNWSSNTAFYQYLGPRHLNKKNQNQISVFGDQLNVFDQKNFVPNIFSTKLVEF